MYACMHACKHTCIHAHIHTHIHTRTHARTHTQHVYVCNYKLSRVDMSRWCVAGISLPPSHVAADRGGQPCCNEIANIQLDMTLGCTIDMG